MISLKTRNSTMICWYFSALRRISSLLKNFPNFKQEDIKIGCFGPTTAKAVKEAGLRLDVEAPTPEAPSMTAALELYLKKEMGSNKKNGK